MTDHPIIYSPPMVHALWDGRKTMTRRLAWRTVLADSGVYAGIARERRPTPWQKVREGDRLWVREAHWRWGKWQHEGDRWRFDPAGRDLDSFGFADKAPGEHFLKRRHDVLAWWRRPAIFHPRDASRLTLLVDATKIERLHAISNRDAIAEGMVFVDHGLDRFKQQNNGWHWSPGEAARGPDFCVYTPQFAFANLWLHLHGPGAWSKNPEVVALTFRVVKANIDRLAEGA